MPESEIIYALDQRLALSATSPTPGTLTDLHKSVYYQWRDLISTGELKPPFEVIHVDGHADLGMGDSSFIYLQEEWIYEADKMKAPKEGGWSGLGCGNFLAFAIVNGWVSSLTYVCHEEAPDDVNRMFFKDWNKESGFIQTKRVQKGDFEKASYSLSEDSIRYEPDLTIPFRRLPLGEYMAETAFDFAFVVRSPSYTPVELDFVNDIIEKRIQSLTRRC